tara:strand:+ start:394 stop:789 length:396 start_codon:yes stop_codon:yes gene_type:complete
VSLLVVNQSVTSPNACYGGWEQDYQLAASQVYPRATREGYYIGELVELHHYVCGGYAPGYWEGYEGRVSVRPLYNDSGLPVYEVFKGEIVNLVGFEFRILDGELRSPWGDYRGFTIALTPQEEFAKMSLWF